LHPFSGFALKAIQSKEVGIMTRFIELSHIVEDGMITYTGLPGPIISDYLSREASREHYEPRTTFQIGRIDMVANTGTYLDAPFHRYVDGHDLSQLDLASIANLDGLVFHVSPGLRAISPDLLDGTNLAGKAVLFHTGWDAYWRTDRYFFDYPYLTRESAEYLIAAKAALVGIDSFNIDDNTDGARPVHTILLGADLPIVEHMCNLAALPVAGFKFFAVPAPVRGMGSFPVRAFATAD
jgi:arylformamidase